VDVFAYSKALADMWMLGGKALLSAQEAGARAMAAGAMPQFPGMTELATDTADLAKAQQAVAELFSAALSLSQSLSRNLPSDPPTDVTVEDTFHRMIDPRGWMGANGLAGEMDDVLGRMAEGPRFSDLWQVERKYARVFRAWMGMRQRGLELSAVTLAAWQRAAQAFSATLAALGGDDAPDANGMLRLWTETANKELLETQRSEPFLQAQAAMIRASTELKLAQHELVEYYGERFGFPTRRELDDVHKTVTSLQRELRALRRANRAEPRAPAALPPPKLRIAAQRKARG